MVTVQKAKFNELIHFYDMNHQPHLENNLKVKSLESHQQEFKNANTLFLSITVKPAPDTDVDINTYQLAGYIILITDNTKNNIQLKRILIDENHIGIGQKSIIAMENYCVTALKMERIWLDVFKSNHRANHVYEKLGYRVFKKITENSRDVLFYEKNF